MKKRKLTYQPFFCRFCKDGAAYMKIEKLYQHIQEKHQFELFPISTDLSTYYRGQD